jgi:hypothetical protein
MRGVFHVALDGSSQPVPRADRRGEEADMAPLLSDGFDNRNDSKPLKDEMVDYIRAHFADVLGDDVRLLDVDGGLDTLALRVRARLADRRAR